MPGQTDLTGHVEQDQIARIQIGGGSVIDTHDLACGAVVDSGKDTEIRYVDRAIGPAAKPFGAISAPTPIAVRVPADPFELISSRIKSPGVPKPPVKNSVT